MSSRGGGEGVECREMFVATSATPEGRVSLVKFSRRAGLGLSRGGGGACVARMIYPGLVSITFRKLAPVEIAALVKKAGLKGVEWGGDIHVPHGNVARAREVREITLEHGLVTAAYGSYYRAGQVDGAGPAFEAVLETAVELGAPTIRVWPGAAGSDTVNEEGRWKVINDLRRIAALAAKAGVSVSMEFHGGTLTDTNESASKLLVEVDHANLFTCWQPHNGAETDVCVEGLVEVLPRVSNLHVFHWWPTAAERHPLAEGAERWGRFLEVVKRVPADRYALMEFVEGDSTDAFLRDGATLRQWLS